MADAVPRVGILGVGVSTLDIRDTVARILAWAEGPRPEGGPRYVCATTVHGLMEAQRDPDFRRILNCAGIVTADGMPLVWIGRIQGHRAMSRVYGPALMLEVTRASAGSRVRHFLYGGVDGVAENLARTLTERFPGLRVVGWYCPPFRPLTEEEKVEVASRINDSGADIVWVGLSTPRQECWAADMRTRLAVKVLVTVGAAFDFHTGRVKQAPALLQRAGLEWAFRLIQEPRRLWRRYLTNNPAFVVLASLELLGVWRPGLDDGAY